MRVDVYLNDLLVTNVLSLDTKLKKLTRQSGPRNEETLRGDIRVVINSTQQGIVDVEARTLDEPSGILAGT